jgi:hypothetical protein
MTGDSRDGFRGVACGQGPPERQDLAPTPRPRAKAVTGYAPPTDSRNSWVHRLLPPFGGRFCGPLARAKLTWVRLGGRSGERGKSADGRRLRF